MLRIPAGKELKLYKSGQPLLNVPLILSEDVSFSLSSQFSPLVSGGRGGTLINMLGTLSRDLIGVGFSSQFSQFGFQQWTGTNPISMSPTFDFYMGSTDANNAEIEVYRPMMELMALPLPEEGKGGVLIPPGPSILAAFGLQERVDSGRIISLEIGNLLRINRVLVSKAEPTWSSEIDDTGYPIWAKIQLDITSLSTATVQMLNNNKSQFNEYLNSVKQAQNIPEEEPVVK